MLFYIVIMFNLSIKLNIMLSQNLLQLKRVCYASFLLAYISAINAQFNFTCFNSFMCVAISLVFPKFRRYEQ